jgi:hypothetical protein
MSAGRKDGDQCDYECDAGRVAEARAARIRE